VLLILAVGLGLHARREYYRRLALGQRAYIAAELRNPSWALRHQWNVPGPGEMTRAEWANHQRALMREYERISYFPWLPFRTPDAWGVGYR
jgi:hypothetical protein